MPTRAELHRSTLICHPMAGDPRFDDSGADGLMTRRACQYAAAMLKKRRQLPDDASGYRATWAPAQRAVMFWRDGTLAAVFRIPDRVMDFRVVCEERDGRHG